MSKASSAAIVSALGARDRARELFLNDPVYHALVYRLAGCIELGEYAADDLRAAVDMAEELVEVNAARASDGHP